MCLPSHCMAPDNAGALGNCSRAPMPAGGVFSGELDRAGSVVVPGTSPHARATQSHAEDRHQSGPFSMRSCAGSVVRTCTSWATPRARSVG